MGILRSLGALARALGPVASATGNWHGRKCLSLRKRRWLVAVSRGQSYWPNEAQPIVTLLIGNSLWGGGGGGDTLGLLLGKFAQMSLKLAFGLQCTGWPERKFASPFVPLCSCCLSSCFSACRSKTNRSRLHGWWFPPRKLKNST